ncbi:hypothetical protein PUN28_011411 [Cardiocondyla obscurior]|uniref:Uncharacterized protein n=1 Tax=Cardiocondyla obscurior TaxID=286306 RepID=A0AAW2FI66_9HYME
MRFPVSFYYDLYRHDSRKVHHRHFPDANVGEDSIPYSQHAPIFTKSFYRFYYSFCLYPPGLFPTRQPLSTIRRIQDRTREKTNFESGCPKGRKSSGRRRAKERKNIPESSAESTGACWFQMIPPLSIFSPSSGAVISKKFGRVFAFLSIY